MPESIQHKLDRVRRPRVQITYDVETLGSIVKTELPFVVGIMADLSGNGIPRLLDPPQPARDNPTSLKDRKYLEIDRDNFNEIMEKLLPKVGLKTAGFTDVELAFKTLDDFTPFNVLRNVPKLKDKYESRTRLSNLVAKLDGNVELQEAFVNSYNSLGDEDKAKFAQYLLTMRPAEGTPFVTDAETTAGRQTTSGLVITPNDTVEGTTKFFKITTIPDATKVGTLTKSDGKTAITEGMFISVEEGADGLKFTPASDFKGDATFTVQASTGNTDDTGLIGSQVNVAITVKPQTPAPGSDAKSETPVTETTGKKKSSGGGA